jgi:putative thioredoxin
MATIDVTEQDFELEVLERSRSTPVVVDFWAEWCGPCRQLGPLLEEAADARQGKVVLAKLDTDANQQLAAAFGIQGIPAVKAFRDGKIVAEFVGAQPKPAVERFFDALVPTEADELVQGGDEESLRKALALEPGRADATVRLADLLVDRGDDAAALELLEDVRGSFAADGLAARLRLRKAQQVPDALTALDAGELERALDLLLEALAARDGDLDADRREDIRRLIVGELDRLGADHPLARETRRRLSAVLY